MSTSQSIQGLIKWSQRGEWRDSFEDLVSAGRAERNVADDYLKRRGWKESAGTRAYIEALRRSSMRLSEVRDIVGGVSFLARDLELCGKLGDGVRRAA